MNNRLGEVRKNNFGTDMKIIRYETCEDIDVQFLDGNYYVFQHTTYPNFKNRCIKNPYDKSVFGIGYVGDGKYQTRVNGVNTIYYNTWHDMIHRCYNEGTKDKFPAYYGICKVCNQWLNMQIFSEWFEENKYECGERLHIDKDILYPGNKIYSPDTCILVPQRINMLFMNKPNKRGLPNGIAKYKSGYLAKYGGKELGIFSTVEEAYIEQTKKKKEAIEELANEYKNIIPKEVYDAVMAYEFRIENDKNYRKCF